MKVTHTSPRKYVAELDRKSILLNFADEEGAAAFDHWFEFAGGSEMFAEWVKTMQIREGKYINIHLEKQWPS
jgi:hypothetical protein